GVQAKLRVEPFEGGEVGLHLLGQLAQVAPLELAPPWLMNVEPLLRYLELDLEKLRGAGRLTPTRLQVLLDVEGREGIGDERDRGRLIALITDREGHRGLALTSGLDPLELELDVPAHALDDFLGWCLRPQIGVEGEAGDQGFQSRAAQDLLADRLEPGLEGTGHAGPH